MLCVEKQLVGEHQQEILDKGKCEGEEEEGEEEEEEEEDGEEEEEEEVVV